MRVCNRIKDLRKKDEEKKKLAEAQNELESFIIDTQDKLYNELYEKCSTEEERDEIRTKFSEASDWLYEQEPDAERKVTIWICIYLFISYICIFLLLLIESLLYNFADVILPDTPIYLWW